MDGLRLQDLEVFLAVERHGSFGRAATELLITQPAVSERIRQLERVVGRPLFDRSVRGAALTPAGEALLPYAARCLALTEETLECVRDAEDVRRFVVAVHSTFAPRVVPWVLGTLGTAPRRIAVRDAHSDVVTALVADGAADIGFVVPGPRPRHVARVPLPPDPVVCVAARGHVVARARRPDLGALAGALVAFNAWGDGSERALARLRAAGVDDWRIRFCGDAATALTLARDHDHVAFVTRSATRADEQALRLVALRDMPQWAVRVDLLHRLADRERPEILALAHAAGQA